MVSLTNGGSREHGQFCLWRFWRKGFPSSFPRSGTLKHTLACRSWPCPFASPPVELRFALLPIWYCAESPGRAPPTELNPSLVVYFDLTLVWATVTLPPSRFPGNFSRVCISICQHRVEGPFGVGFVQLSLGHPFISS